MKTAIFKVILPKFIEEKYQSTGYFSPNIHWNSTLSAAQIKDILWGIFFNLKITQNYQLSQMLCRRSKKTPKGPKYIEGHWKLRRLMRSSSKLWGGHAPQFCIIFRMIIFISTILWVFPWIYIGGAIPLSVFNFVRSSNHWENEYQ